MVRHTPAASVVTPSESEVTMAGMDDDWQSINDAQGLPLRPAEAHPVDRLEVRLHPIQTEDALLVSVRPPKIPETGLNRPSCDIVLVIDVSGSMASSAPLPDVADQTDKEAGGLSILDLTKHAARTILQELKEGDRLGIVTFSFDAKVVQKLIPMTAKNKGDTWDRIESLRDEGATNLWAGIKTGLNLFENAELKGNVQGLYILTDGQPNHMCPQKGYVNSLRPILTRIAKNSEGARAPTIHTFGFGYGIRSDLMSSIAEVGNGSYAFIPDAGMIGTVFVHAVANLFATLGTCATLELKALNSRFWKQLEMTVPAGLAVEAGDNDSLIVKLGNIQYGQTRDIWVECPKVRADTVISAVLSYNLPNGASRGFQAQVHFSEVTGLTAEQLEYQRYRAEICAWLSTLFPVMKNGEHTTIGADKELKRAQSRLDTLIARIKACPEKGAGVASLANDLAGDEPAGQISKAMLMTREQQYWPRWGRHYLPSLLHAHQRQMCNTFKDPGPLLYGQDSPLFIQCRDELDAAFDSLPAPKPSRPPPMITTVDSRGRVTHKMGKHAFVSMRRYNSSSNPCFEGTCKVTMADRFEVAIKAVKPGMQVWTPAGARRVAAVLKTLLPGSKRQPLCQIGQLLVTPWHPIKHQGRWTFPAAVAERTVGFQGAVYSVLLAPSKDTDAHAIEVGGHLCVTLGHGVMRAGSDDNDVRAHAFFGNHCRVAVSLSRLPLDKNGHRRCVGVQRDARTGRVCAFTSPMRSKRVATATATSGAARRIRGAGMVGAL